MLIWSCLEWNGIYVMYCINKKILLRAVCNDKHF